MRMVGLIGVLLALVIVGLLLSKQLRATRTALPDAVTAVPGAAPIAPASTVRAQALQTQQQVKEALDAAMQQSVRSLPDDAR
jgi:hypothetical protein